MEPGATQAVSPGHAKTRRTTHIPVRSSSNPSPGAVTKMSDHIAGWRNSGDERPGGPGRRRRENAGAWRRRQLAFDSLEARRLLSVNIAEFPIRVQGGEPQGVASGAGTDRSLVHAELEQYRRDRPGQHRGRRHPVPHTHAEFRSRADRRGARRELLVLRGGGEPIRVHQPDHRPHYGDPRTSARTTRGRRDGRGAQWDRLVHRVQYEPGRDDQYGDRPDLRPLVTPGAQPYGIVEGPDGNMWFTEAGANKIGTINPRHARRA